MEVGSASRAFRRSPLPMRGSQTTFSPASSERVWLVGVLTQTASSRERPELIDEDEQLVQMASGGGNQKGTGPAHSCSLQRLESQPSQDGSTEVATTPTGQPLGYRHECSCVRFRRASHSAGGRRLNSGSVESCDAS